MTLAPTLAAVFATGEPERLYSGLSVLVSTAVDGSRCAGLATFRSLELLLAPPTSALGERFDRSLEELIVTARELESLDLYACAASVDLMGIEEPLDGVVSTPRFLRDVAGANLIFV